MMSSTNEQLALFQQRHVKVYEWMGTIHGIIGSALLALNVNVSGYGFLFYLVSNAFFIFFGLKTRSYGILTLQCVYTVTSVVGIYRWLY